MALINVDVTDEEQIELLKKEYKELQMGTVTCLSSGFILLLATPFMFSAKDNYFWAFSRYASLVGTLSLGATSIVCLKRLEEIEPQYTVIKKAETRTFINKSATSEFTLMKLFEREAGTILRPPQPVLEPHSLEPSQPDSQHSQNDSLDNSQSLPEANSEDSQPDSQRIANDSANALPEQATDKRTERIELLKSMLKNRRTKAQIISKIWGVDESDERYSYYLQTLEQMIAEIRSQDNNS